MKIYKVYPEIQSNACCEKNIENVISWIENAEIGDMISIKIINMTEEEYNLLPEFMGP